MKALPLGGYVKIAGMNPYQPVAPEDLPRAYGSKPRWQRALVIFAGPGIHFLIAAVLFGASFVVSGDYSTATPVITEVVAQLNGHTSPATAAGLRAGDRIVGVDDLEAPNLEAFSAYVTAHIGDPVAVHRPARRRARRISPSNLSRTRTMSASRSDASASC